MNIVHAQAEGGLARYLEIAKQFPMLDFEREQQLAYAWRDDRDQVALRHLVNSHLRLVIKIARGFAGYGLPVADLIAEGNVGLMQAAEKFDPDRGFRFATYAQWWVRAAIQEYILHNWSLVKMGTTAAQKKLFFNLRRLKGQLAELEQGDLDRVAVTKIATELGVPETEVVEMNRRMASTDGSLNMAIGAEGDNEWLDLLADERPTHESVLADRSELGFRKDLLDQALERLNERERTIIQARRLSDDPITLEELAQTFSVSRERIRQIENRAFEKLQKAVLNAAATWQKNTMLQAAA